MTVADDIFALVNTLATTAETDHPEAEDPYAFCTYINDPANQVALAALGVRIEALFDLGRGLVSYFAHWAE